jgi:hypothetical protein
MWNAKTQVRLIRLEDVAACQVDERDGSFLITVIYQSEAAFSKLKLETPDPVLSKEMAAKLKFLINERSSVDVQTQFTAYKEKKVQRRKTLHF